MRAQSSIKTTEQTTIIAMSSLPLDGDEGIMTVFFMVIPCMVSAVHAEKG